MNAAKMRRGWEATYRVDLLPTDAPITTAGTWIIANVTPPAGQRYLVMSYACFAQVRVNVGTPQERAMDLAPGVFNHQAFYALRVGGAGGGGAALGYTSTALVNRPRQAAGVLTATDVSDAAGTTCVSANPHADVMGSWGNMPPLVVPGGKVLQVTFSLIPAGIASPMLGVFAVGGAVNQRVDFAGIVLGIEIEDDTAR